MLHALVRFAPADTAEPPDFGCKYVDPFTVLVNVFAGVLFIEQPDSQRLLVLVYPVRLNAFTPLCTGERTMLFRNVPLLLVPAGENA